MTFRVLRGIAFPDDTSQGVQTTANSPSDPNQPPGKLDTTFHKEYVIHQQTRTSWWGVRATEKWRRERKLGEGGYGTVHLETEEKTHQYRAVKEVSKRGSKFDVKRELRILLALRDHPIFFVQFLGWYEDKVSIFLAMEYVEHGDLRNFLNKFGRQSEENAKEITTQVLEGLVTLHKSEICYRDLKPENILIASRSPINIKLADFGISKCTIDTHLRTKCGTDLYLAPELKGFLSRGKEYTNAVDLWALGCLVHEILTLKIPFSKIDPGLDTSQESGLAIPTGVAVIEMDNSALLDFCRGTIDFPTETLQKFHVSSSGIDFVKRLLAADPSFRVSAADALLSGWLLGSPYPSTGSQEISGSYGQFKKDVDSKVLQRQFLGVGMGVSLRTIDILVMHSTKDVDATRLLPSLTIKITGILQHAVSKGYVLLLRILLEFQAISIKSVRAQCSTLLSAAARCGCIDIVKLLLEKGADVNALSGSRTALQVAVGHGHLDIAKLLLEKGADVNALSGGRTALQAAAGGGHLDIVKLLLEKGADINALGRCWTVLQAAVDCRRPDIVKLFLEKGADVNALSGGRTALQEAAGDGHLDIVKLLLEKGADVNVFSRGRTALQAAAGGGHLDIVKLLLEKGADVNVFSRGRTALQAAAGDGHLDIVKLLLEKGADVNVFSRDRTALQAAAGGGHLDIVKLLLEKGANVNASSWCWTALQAAAGDGHLDIVKLLLEKGADINAELSYYNGRTALQAAAGGGHLDIVKLLLEEGADVNAVPSHRGGQTALQAAADHGHLDIVKLLRREAAIYKHLARFSWRQVRREGRYYQW